VLSSWKDPRSAATIDRNAVRRYDAYYNGEFYEYPSAVIAYELAEALSRGRNDLLWLAIVGLTEASY
jgi:hypothetical protein